MGPSGAEADGFAFEEMPPVTATDVVRSGPAWRAVIASTIAFFVCFGVWMLYGVLVTFLVDNRVYDWSKTSIGWLIGTPTLTGAVMRLPLGVLTDRFGGRAVMTALMLVTAIPVYLVSATMSYQAMIVAGLGVGLAGASFAVGVAYVSVWFPPERQGTVLGIFGMGNSGAALTSLIAPGLLNSLTGHGANLDAWRTLPKIYAGVLIVTAVLFWLVTDTRKTATNTTLRQRLEPLGQIRVWRFGFYYAFLFGSFVALSQWLVPYYVNVYTMSIATAGLLAAAFSLPAGIVRAVGGWLADRKGARTVLYWSFGLSIALLVLLFPPRMELQAPGQGLLADRPGVVTAVSDTEIIVDTTRYGLQSGDSGEAEITLGIHDPSEGVHLFPRANFRQYPVVEIGQRVGKGDMLARGVTQLYFQANRWVFTAIVLAIGIMLGLGSGAVFKHIPTYFPGRVGVVGGIVGVLGGLGGFAEPILFGYLLAATGIWTSSWMLLALFGIACLLWMHVVVRRMVSAQAPELSRRIDCSSGA